MAASWRVHSSSVLRVADCSLRVFCPFSIKASSAANYPPTKATPAVWAQAEKFEQLHQAFIKATDELALAAKARKKEAVEAPYKRVHDTCHDCHETFKKR